MPTISSPRVEDTAKALREEIVRQYRDEDRRKCPAGVAFWEEHVQPVLLAEVALKALSNAEAEEE